MTKVIGIILIVASVGLAIWGFQVYNNNRAGISIGDAEISAQEKGYTHYILWVAGGICLGSGIAVLVRN